MKTVISVGTAKEAALYFERVFPHGLAETMFNVINYADQEDLYNLPVNANSPEFRKVIESLLPGDDSAYNRFFDYFTIEYCRLLLRSLEYGERLSDTRLGGLNTTVELLNKRFPVNLKASRLLKRPTDFMPKLTSLGDKVLKEGRLLNTPLWVDERFLERHKDLSDTSQRGSSSFAISLRNLNLVDASRVPWDLIIEFRKDKESRDALRDLRLFFADNFEGKDQEYISDKLQQQMDRYESTAKLWGLETVNKALTVAINDAPTVMASVGVLAVAATSLSLPLAAAAAAVLPIGKSALAFWQLKIDAKRDRLDRPVRYLTQLKALDESGRET